MPGGFKVLRRLVGAARVAGGGARRRRPVRREQLTFTWGSPKYHQATYDDRFGQLTRWYVLTIEVTDGRVTPEHFVDDGPLVVRPEEGQFLALPMDDYGFLRNTKLSDGVVTVPPQVLRRKHHYQLYVSCSEDCGPLTWSNLSGVDVRYQEEDSVRRVERWTLARVLKTAAFALLSVAVFGFASWILVWAASFLVAGERIEGTATGETFDKSVCIAAQCTDYSATHSVVTYTTDEGTTERLAVIGNYQPGATVDVLVSPLGGPAISTELEAVAYVGVALAIFYYGARVLGDLAY
ncbi:hypothetical protein ACFO6V_01725 [Promicromonospora alba]|uniref:PH (Pleckstrin Homology) domain-containing protein n=1 Tax=Promicromonospora alba TaxID=1616110 RepID=A0ABV9H9G6_9MICO